MYVYYHWIMNHIFRSSSIIFTYIMYYYSHINKKKVMAILTPILPTPMLNTVLYGRYNEILTCFFRTRIPHSKSS